MEKLDAETKHGAVQIIMMKRLEAYLPKPATRDLRTAIIRLSALSYGYVPSLNAVELLFGITREDAKKVLTLGFRDREIFAYLLDNYLSHPFLMVLLVRNHRWVCQSASPSKGGISIQVYPNEWLIFEEPEASHLVCLLADTPGD